MDSAAWQHLPAFLAVVEHGGFTRAARSLGVSPSAVSQAVRALEASVGAPLLLRTTRSVSATEVGEQLLRRAAPAVKQVGEALEAAATPRGELSGSLRLTVPAIALPHVVMPMVERFSARHPRVLVDLSVENRLVNIVTERFDAGVRLEEVLARDMVTTRLSGPFRFVVVASPEYLSARGTPRHPRELASHSLIGYRSPTNGALIPWDLERRGVVHKVPMHGPLCTNHEGVLLDAALRGLGMSYVAETTAADALGKGRLRVVLEAWAPEVPGFFLYYPSRKTSANLRAFISAAASRVGRG
jgi:DNA-binding transcriptional LysR family regulator